MVAGCDVGRTKPFLPVADVDSDFWLFLFTGSNLIMDYEVNEPKSKS